MNSRAKTLTLAAGVLVIFAAGVFFGTGLRKSDPASTFENTPTAGNGKGKATESAAGLNRKNADKHNAESKSAVVDHAKEATLGKIRDARLLPAGERMTPLLRALEETTKLPLDKQLLQEFRSILEEGEIESVSYILSLIEQREEKPAVDFLLEVAANPNADVADRAMFALEAVAGNVFKNRDAAVAWASTWQPDPERAKLFSPSQGTSDDNHTDTTPRIPGPAGFHEKKKESEK